jgi:hypothetical protein
LLYSRCGGLASSYRIDNENVLINLPVIDANASISPAEMTSEYNFLQRVDPKLQASLLFNEPLRFVRVLYNGYALYGKEIMRGTTGDLGWANVKIPEFAITLSWILLGIVTAFNAPALYGLRFRLISLLIFLLMTALIPLALYLSWTPVGADYFLGVSGRYFIPLLPLFFISTSLPLAGSGLVRRLPALVVIISAAILISSLIAICRTYYSRPATAWILRLVAQSDAIGTAVISTGKGDGKLIMQGRYNLIPSDEHLQYEFRLPDGDNRLTAINISSPGKISFRIRSAELLTIDGQPVKKWHYYQTKISRVSPEGHSFLVSPGSEDEFILDKKHNSMFFVDAAASPMGQKSQADKKNAAKTVGVGR